MLSNLYLDGFDRAMLVRGYRAIRYSDDIAIPVPDRGTAERALSDVAGELADLGLKLDPVKSQVVSFDVGVPFLGSTVTSLTSPGAMALSHPLETVVYVDRPGSLVRSRGERMVVEHQGETLLRLNLKRIRQVVCVGRVGMTTPFMHRAVRDGIDPVNAMLSFGYTLLVQEAIAALEMTGLDAAVRFLHRARWGRPCLALDLIEEFRPVIVDAVVLRCLSTGNVRFEEFETIPDRGCRMNARARQAFLAAYERRMLTIFTHEPTGRRVSYRVGMSLQAKALAHAILDPERTYRSVRWK